jgi:hypothetical protein
MPRLKDVPQAAAYLVWHDAFDNGAMDVYLYSDLTSAQIEAEKRNCHLQESSNDDCGFWRAYTKLPRVRIYKVVKGGK